MRKSPSFYVRLLIPFLVLLIAGQGLAWGFVLCIDADGHSAFEQAVAGQCVPDDSQCHSAAGPSTFDHGSHCHDIPLSFDSLHHRFTGDQDLAASLLLPINSFLSAARSYAIVRDSIPDHLSSQPPPRPYQALFALRTVILLH